RIAQPGRRTGDPRVGGRAECPFLRRARLGADPGRQAPRGHAPIDAGAPARVTRSDVPLPRRRRRTCGRARLTREDMAAAGARGQPALLAAVRAEGEAAAGGAAMRRILLVACIAALAVAAAPASAHP